MYGAIRFGGRGVLLPKAGTGGETFHGYPTGPVESPQGRFALHPTQVRTRCKTRARGPARKESTPRRANPTQAAKVAPVPAAERSTEPPASSRTEAVKRNAFNIVCGSKMNRDANALAVLAGRLQKALDTFLETYDGDSVFDLLMDRGLTCDDWDTLDFHMRALAPGLVEDARGLAWALNVFVSIFEGQCLPLPEERARWRAEAKKQAGSRTGGGFFARLFGSKRSR